MSKILRATATGSVLLMPSEIVLAGHHLFRHQPDRPIASPACDPAWGYHATCWNRFPAIAACGQWTASGNTGGAGVGVTPATSLSIQGSAPISILPDRGHGVLVPDSPQQPAAVPHPGVPHSVNPLFPLPPLPGAPQPRYEYEPPDEGQQQSDPGAQSQLRYRIPPVSPAVVTGQSGIILPARVMGSGRYGTAVSRVAD